MSFKIELTDRAQSDIIGIFNYITYTIKAPVSALNLLDNIEQSIYSLSELPLRFPCCNIEPWKSKGVRYMPVKNYTVFYLPDEIQQTVTVIRVLYSKSDYKNRLREIMP